MGDHELFFGGEVAVQSVHELGVVETVVEAIECDVVQHLAYLLSVPFLTRRISTTPLILPRLIVVTLLHEIATEPQYLLMQPPVLETLGRYTLNQIRIKVINIIRIHQQELYGNAIVVGGLKEKGFMGLEPALKEEGDVVTLEGQVTFDGD